MKVVPLFFRRASLLGALFFLLAARADTLEMSNGDRYLGRVVTVTDKEVEFQSKILGVIKLPRAEVSVIAFGERPLPALASPRTTSAVPAQPSGTNQLANRVAKQMQRQKIDPQVLQQVQSNVLEGASPEASKLFNQMVQGFTTGKLSANDIRKQATDALNQLNDLKRDLGDDELSSLLDSYSAILQSFLKQPGTAPSLKSPGTPGVALPSNTPLDDE